MLGIWNSLLEKRALTYLIIAAIVLYGAYSMLSMKRESSPEIQVPVAVVSTVLPGASPEDVEQLVTNEIEKAVGNIADLKTLTSTSRDGVSVVVAEFNASANLQESIQKVKDEVGKVQSDLPDDATTPSVTDVNFADQPVVIAALSSDLPVTQFKQFADDVKDQLEEIGGVSRVDVSGVRGREVNVIIHKESLWLYNLSLSDVIAGIASNNAALPVGTIEQNGIEYAIALKSDLTDPSEVANLPILTRDGKTLYVRDVALVSDGVEDATTLSRVSVEGKPSAQAATLTVYKQRGGDITKMTTDVRAKLNEIKNANPAVEMFVSYDGGDEIRHDLKELSRIGLEAVLLVMISLFITLGWREALIAGLSIPLTILASFIALKLSGNTINFISLFSLILSIGILVDSAIVVAEAIHVNLSRGMDKFSAAKKAVIEYSFPLTAGTLTTVAFFVPLFTISGVTGQFIKSIPFTVIFVLLSSIFVALGLIPLLASLALRARNQSDFEKKQERYAEDFRNWYRRNIARLLDNRRAKYKFVFGLIVLFFISISLPIVGLVKVTFFPGGDIDYLYLEIEEPQGTPLSRTDLATRAVEEKLYAIPEIESFTTTVGTGSSFNQNASQGPRFASININLRKDRERTSTEVLSELKEEAKSFKEFTVRAFEPSNGPPSGAPIEVTLSGKNLEDLKFASLEVKNILVGVEGTSEVISSAQADASEFSITIDRAAAAELGLSPLQIAQTLRTAVFGTESTTIKKDGEETKINVKVGLNTNFRTPHDTTVTNIDSIRNLPITTAKGTVLLGSVINVSLDSASDLIRHKDQERIVTVTSQVASGAVAADVTKRFETQAKTALKLPDGVSMRVGGENEDVDQSFQDMFLALIIGAVLVLIILIIEFNQYRQSLFVLSVVPLSLIGVLFGLLVTRQAVSFPTMLGFIALAGVVVNHAIILMDVFNRLRVEHPEMPIREVVIEGGAIRLRPILLTKITSIIGLVPLLFAAALWNPIATSMIFGLSFTGVLTLILLPILYLKWPGHPVRHIHNGIPNSETETKKKAA